MTKDEQKLVRDLRIKATVGMLVGSVSALGDGVLYGSWGGYGLAAYFAFVSASTAFGWNDPK